MGQSQNTMEGAPPVTPPEVEVTRRREDYLHRLGIQKDQESYASFHPQTTYSEAPAILEHGGRARALSSQDGVETDFEVNVLDLKSQDDFRVNFLRKLSYSQVWVPKAQRPPKHQTVIIFDWDDTLLCTSYLNLRQDQNLSGTTERHLREIEGAARKLLELAMTLGHTFIITNAMNGWVEYSSAKWCQKCCQFCRSCT